MKNLFIMLIFSLVCAKTSAQFMGINVPVPLYPLHVAGHIANPESTIIQADGDSPNYATINVNATNPTAIVGYSFLSSGVFLAMLGVNQANDFFIKVGTNTLNAIYAKNSDNNVGINTSNPLANLDVNGTVKLGVNGIVFTNLIKVSVTVDIPSTASNGTFNQTFAVTNAVVGGVVSISPNAQLTTGMIIQSPCECRWCECRNF